MKKIKLLVVAILAACLSAQAQALATEPIEIVIPDIKINKTTLKRKAKLFTMIYNMQSKHLTLSWEVSYYADSAGNYGSRLDLNGISSYIKESVANNTVQVNALTGEILKPDENGNYPSNIPTMGQYDWFYTMAENHQLEVHNLIRAYGLSAEW